MMQTAAATGKAKEEIKLVCPECRRENEAERVYCHDCGARLDRSKLAKVKAKEEDPKETQRRLMKMLDQRRAAMRKRFFDVCKLVLAAWLLAGVVQMIRPPELPPRAAVAPAELPPQINLDLENLTMDAHAAPLRYSEDQLNAYLSYALKSKQTALSKYLKFERLVVGLDEGSVHVTMERSLYGYSVFSSGIYTVAVRDGNVIFHNVGGQIGRLQIHPKLMQYGDILFADVRGVLERERKLLAKLGGIELHAKQVVFNPKTPQT